MFSIADVSKEPCTLFGYPEVQLLGAGRQLISATTGRGELGPMEPASPVRVLLTATGMTAKFGLSFIDHLGPASRPDCVTFAYVRMILPDKQVTNAASVSTGHVLACGGRCGPQILIGPIGA